MNQIMLLTTPEAYWPEEISSCSLQELSLEELESMPIDTSSPPELWMGYSSPLDCLQQALNRQSGVDPEPLLQRWRSCGERFLEQRRQHPQHCHLVNLGRLTSHAIGELSARLGGQQPFRSGQEWETAAGSEKLTTGPADPELSPLPSSLMELVISQQSTLQEIYADLEAQAELFGRDPQFKLGLPACRDPALGMRLLKDGLQRHLSMRAAQDSNRRLKEQLELREAERDQALREARDQQQKHEELQDTLKTLEATLSDERSRNQASAAEAAALRQEQEDEIELLLLQLKQLQEELSHTFETLQTCQTDCRDKDERLLRLETSNAAVSEELKGLSKECRHLFQHSQLQPGIDREQIGRILSLVRQSLQS